jgi:hypothetical protein
VLPRTEDDALRWLRIGFGVICLVKVIDLVDRMSAGGVALPGAIAVVWVGASIAILAGERSTFVAAPVVAALTVWLFTQSSDLRNQHMYLLVWLPAVLTLAAGRARGWQVAPGTLIYAVRVQCSILYAFAALSKVTEDYLSGSVINSRVNGRPLGDLLGFGDIRVAWPFVAVSLVALVIEASLAVGLWTRWWRWFMALGLGFHLLMVPLMSEDLVSTARLSVFSGLVLLMYVAFLPLEESPTAVPARSEAAGQAPAS